MQIKLVTAALNVVKMPLSFNIDKLSSDCYWRHSLNEMKFSNFNSRLSRNKQNNLRKQHQMTVTTKQKNQNNRK